MSFKNKNLHALWLLMVFGFMYLVPLVVYGQGLVPCSGSNCNLASFVLLVQNVINFFLFTLAFPISAAMFAIAGIMMFTAGGRENQIKKAKTIFWSVAVGLIIMFAAWIIVYTITNTLLDDEFEENIPEEVQLNS